MRLKRISIRSLIIQILNIVQIINVFLNIKVLAALILIVKNLLDTFGREDDETK